MNPRVTCTASFLALFLFTASSASCGMKTPEIKRNPHPKQRYEFTLTIQDAPGPIESVTSSALYETDQDCIPVQALSGATPQLSEHIRIPLTPTGPNSYRGEFYADILIDQDYFGLGVCRWSFQSVGIAMKAGDVTFGSGMSALQLAANSSSYTEYFAKTAYGKTDIPDRVATPLPTNYIASRRAEDFFSTVLTVREQSE